MYISTKRKLFFFCHRLFQNKNLLKNARNFGIQSKVEKKITDEFYMIMI